MTESKKPVSTEDLKKALDKCPKIKAGFVPKKEDGSYDWESLSIKQELKLIRFDTWRKLVEAKFSVFKADYDLQVHVPRKQLSELIKQCPLVPTLYNMTLYNMTVLERSRLLAEHSVTLDEWYHNLKKELLEATQK